MWETIELREIRLFLVLAEELHFGRAAERLELSQSRVSQTLRKLEAKLGGQLVNRTSRHVSLTPLGESVRTKLDGLYRDLMGVLESAHTENHALDGTLRLGLLLAPSGGPHLTAIVRTFEQRHAACSVRVTEIGFDDALGALRRGEIDVMAARLPLEQPDLVIGPILSREPRVLAVARDHPLAERDAISIEDVADYPVAPFADVPTELADAIVPRMTPSGRPIRRLSRRPSTTHELLALIARGAIVHPTVPSSLDYFGHPDVTQVPISDLPDSRSALIRRRGVNDARVRAFTRVAAEILPDAWQTSAGNDRQPAGDQEESAVRVD